jgi:hypothetical protein
MLARLIVGIMKGLVVGGLVGFAILKLGFAVMPGWLAYVAAAISGVLIGLIAGKPIWAKDAKIEAGMKAAVGAFLGAGLMFAARKWLTMPLPSLPEALGGAQIAAAAKETGLAVTLGQFSMTSLAAIAALLGGFYDADNTPEPEGEAKQDGAAASEKAAPQKRIAAPPAEDDFEDELLDEADQKKAKK